MGGCFVNRAAKQPDVFMTSRVSDGVGLKPAAVGQVALFF
jgi:hypothetical protein